MIYVVVVFALLFIIIINKAAYDAKYGIGDVKIQFLDSKTGRTIHVGNGSSISEALVDGFSKMYNSISASSHEDTIQSKLDSMNDTLSMYRSRMWDDDIIKCEEFIRRMQDTLDQKHAEQQRIEQKKREAEQEKKQQKAAKVAQLEKQRRNRNKALSERKEYITEQRRLMTPSMRYDVMRRDNFRCVLCGATAADGVTLHVDHIYPLAKGGKTEPSNLRTLCDRCNLGKGTKIEGVNTQLQRPKQTITSFASMNEFLSHLDEIGIEYIDKRSKGGCLWIRSSAVVDSFLSDARVADKRFYKAGSSSNFNGDLAWFIK